LDAACPGCSRRGDERRCAFCGVTRNAGGYLVDRVLAQGPHGRVYRAQAPDGEIVALKELQFAQVPGAAQIDAFEREAATLKTLHHPRIPRFVASFAEGEGVQLRLYLAAEFIEGEPLSTRIARGPFSEAMLSDVARQVLGVLVYLHKLGVLHRDIKPDNLIVRPGGEIVLVDFGSARRLSGSRTYGSTLVGTFGYMPTEQLGGTVDATSDLYALGATLLHAATGKVLHSAIESIKAQPKYEPHKQDRSFMAVHGKAKEKCPRCGHRISELTARGEATDFCRGCQH